MSFPLESPSEPIRSLPGRSGEPRRVYLMATAQLIFPEESPIGAYTINVSYGGICLYTRQLVPADSDVLVKIFYPEHAVKDYAETIRGTVKWYRSVGNMYGIGIRFSSIDPDQHPVLLAMLERPEAEENI